MCPGTLNNHFVSDGSREGPQKGGFPFYIGVHTNKKPVEVSVPVSGTFTFRDFEFYVIGVPFRWRYVSETLLQKT